jgi:hypothetical protein
MGKNAADAINAARKAEVFMFELPWFVMILLLFSPAMLDV